MSCPKCGSTNHIHCTRQADIDAAGLDAEFRPDRLGTPVTVETNAATLVAVHGLLALALTHPQAAPHPSAELAAKFARAALGAAVEAGLFTERGLRRIAGDKNIEDRVLPDELLARRKGRVQ